jgi:1-acyl-sn-glycerol-3-phosphate acyltransferase
MTSSVPESLDPAIPQFPQNVWRRFCRWILILFGWKFAGEFPRVSKLVFIAAPHSSWWDGVWGLLFKAAIGLDTSFMAKKELFFWPLGWLLRTMGGIPVERGAANGIVPQMVKQFQTQERLWVGIAAEGTRRQVRKWKSGFWHIARDAGVPIMLLYFHYPEKTIGVGPLIEPTPNLEADMVKIREFYVPWKGKHRGTV